MTDIYNILAGLHVLLVTDDSLRANALLGALREREVRAFDMGSPRDDVTALMAADLIVVDTRAETNLADTLRMLKSDVRARWAARVRVDFASILPGDGSVHLKTLTELCAPALTDERELTERTRRETAHFTRLAPLGPTRILRALAKAGPALHILFEEGPLRLEIELANELLVSAKAEVGVERLEAWSALTRLLALEDADVRIDRRPFPSSMNIMEPLGQALEVAAQEYLCTVDKSSRAAAEAAADARETTPHFEPRSATDSANRHRTLMGVMAPAAGTPASPAAPSPQKPFVPARPPRPSLPTSPQTTPLNLTVPSAAAGVDTPKGGVPESIVVESQPGKTPSTPSRTFAAPPPEPRYQHRTGRSPERSANMTLLGFKAPPGSVPPAASTPVVLPATTEPAAEQGATEVPTERPTAGEATAKDTSSASALDTPPAAPAVAEASAETDGLEVDLRKTQTFERSSAHAMPSSAAYDEPKFEEATIVVDRSAVDGWLGVAADAPSMHEVEHADGAPDEDDESLGAASSPNLAKTVVAPKPEGEAAIDTDRVGGEAAQETVRLDSMSSDDEEKAVSAEDTWVGGQQPAANAAPAPAKPARPAVSAARQRGKAWPVVAGLVALVGAYVATQYSQDELPGQSTPGGAPLPVAPALAPEPAEPTAAGEPGVAAPRAEPVAFEEPAPTPAATAPAATAPAATAPAPAATAPAPAAKTPAPAPAAPSTKTPDALAREGLILMQSHGRDAALRARPIFEEVIARDPINPHGYAGLAQAQLALGDPQTARHNIEEAIKLRSRRARYRVIQGDILNALGKSTEARAAWDRALELDPKDPEAQARVQK